MVAKNGKELTDTQFDSCAGLSAWIASRHPSIEYPIGHHEYMRKDLPHFALFREKDPSYAPTVKVDPGDAFMKRLRDLLASRYSLSLKK
jgi:beta-N-acetylhexosaminidase